MVDGVLGSVGVVGHEVKTAFLEHQTEAVLLSGSVALLEVLLEPPRLQPPPTVLELPHRVVLGLLLFGQPQCHHLQVLGEAEDSSFDLEKAVAVLVEQDALAEMLTCLVYQASQLFPLLLSLLDVLDVVGR